MSESFFPDAVRGIGVYPWRRDLRLNSWAFVAVGVAMGCRVILAAHLEWGVAARAGVALAPLVPGWLYARSLARWLHGMDELQRQLQMRAFLFATTATVFVVTGLSLLAGAGVLEGMRFRNGLGWEGSFAALVGFMVLGNLLVNRRYR